MDRPWVSGVAGYTAFDPTKRVVQATLLGGRVIDMLVDLTVIEIIEQYMQSDCVLAEATLKHDHGVGYVYFPLHADFCEGWTKVVEDSGTAPRPYVTAADMNDRLGVGGAIYLHDTAEGGFCYCVGTHKMGAPHGVRIANYPEDLRAEIVAKKVRVDGLRGDYILFDDRGFHGPEQPCTVSRRVILTDFYRVASLGHTQVSPMPIWSTDIARLDPRQARVIGVGATYWTGPMHYTQTRFKQHRYYDLLCRAIDNAYAVRHWKSKLKRMLGRDREAV